MKRNYFRLLVVLLSLLSNSTAYAVGNPTFGYGNLFDFRGCITPTPYEIGNGTWAWLIIHDADITDVSLTLTYYNPGKGRQWRCFRYRI